MYYMLSKEMHSLDIAVNNILQQTLEEYDMVGEISTLQLYIIRFVMENGEKHVYQRDVEKEFGFTRSTASRILLQMEQKELIIRSGVEHDARLKKLTLTEKSAKVGEAICQTYYHIDQKLINGFTDEERKQLFYLIDRMRENIAK